MSRLDMLVEIGTEEIPAGYLGPALTAWEERLTKALADNRLEYTTLRTWGSPRRLAVAVTGLNEQQPDIISQTLGPPVKVSFDPSGSPTKAALSFADREGVKVADLVRHQTEKGLYLMAKKLVKGRPASEVLVEILPPMILGLPFPKTMRWGQGEVIFVRPIHWLLAVLGGQVLPMSLGDIKAAAVSYGHRFLAPDSIEIRSPHDYEPLLAAAHVIASFDRRQDMVRDQIRQAAAEVGDGFQVLPDEDLVAQVANLVELPVATLGRFDESYLKLPAEVLVTAMREHQRYFALTDAAGRLAPYFIAINNMKARDMNVVRRGHQRVLRARLDDARFYFQEDTKTTLASKRTGLEKVVFHTLLGTSWQKVERFSRLAEYLVDSLEPQFKYDRVKANLMRAADLCKCDLVSGVVGQFPALQGIMGREYARLDGESEEVAVAIAEHYLPNRAGGQLPQTQAGALLSLADKMDTIAGCFGVGLIPTGAADPYALRRQALGIINIILDKGYRMSLRALIDQALLGLEAWLKRPAMEVGPEIIEFIRLRFKNQLTGQGVSTDGAEAVLFLHHDDLVAGAAKVAALERIKARPDFADLAIAFKRVVNIIKKFGPGGVFDPARLTADQERALSEACGQVEAQAPALVEADNYEDLLTAIVELKPVIDAFFDHVLVDDPDQDLKANRLALLARVWRLFELVADFSKITT